MFWTGMLLVLAVISFPSASSAADADKESASLTFPPYVQADAEEPSQTQLEELAKALLEQPNLATGIRHCSDGDQKNCYETETKGSGALIVRSALLLRLMVMEQYQIASVKAMFAYAPGGMVISYDRKEIQEYYVDFASGDLIILSSPWLEMQDRAFLGLSIEVTQGRKLLVRFID